MRWCYKTVHYELKKEGFLGSAFLDEAEVEQSLNEYGQAGWELISIVETHDGLIAVFKQRLDYTDKKLQDKKPANETGEKDTTMTELITTDKRQDQQSQVDNSKAVDGLCTIRIE